MDKLHYLGSEYASRTACGRLVLAHRSDRKVKTTAIVANVTCLSCGRAMAS